MIEFSGIYTALITPFDKDLEINYGMIGELVRFQEKNQVSGIIPCGTNGEFSSLTLEEAKKVINSVVDAKKNAKIVAGAGRASIKETIELVKHSEEIVDAVMILPPYYFKPISEEGLYKYYKKIFESSKMPIFIYNVPKYTGINVSVLLIKKLMSFSNLIGIKDSSGNIETTTSYIKTMENLVVFCGSDALMLDLFKIGARGGISAISNVYPSEINSLYEIFKKGDLSKAEKIQIRIKEIRKIFKMYQSISAFKCILQDLGFDKSLVRPPLTNLTESEYENVKNSLRKIEVPK